MNYLPVDRPLVRRRRGAVVRHMSSPHVVVPGITAPVIAAPDVAIPLIVSPYSGVVAGAVPCFSVKPKLRAPASRRVGNARPWQPWLAVALHVALLTGCGGTDESTQDVSPATAADVTSAGADTADADGQSSPHSPAQQALLNAVDPFIGTSGIIANLGNTSPAATAPLGMVKAGPDTSPSTVQPSFSHCSGYLHTDKWLLGFSHNRLHGTGIPDYGNVLLLPTNAMTPERATRYGRRVALDHDTEKASPGRYDVRLHAPEIDVSLVATPRCAIHRYRWTAPSEQGAKGVVLVDAAAAQAKGRSRGGAVTLNRKSGQITGWSHAHGAFSGRYGGYRVYFAVQFDAPVIGGGVWSGGVGDGGKSSDIPPALMPSVDATETSADPANFGAWAEFDVHKSQVIQAKVCLSYVDIAGAKAAMAKELPDWNLKAAQERTEQRWIGHLQRIEVSGATEETRVRLYTALYHTLQMPTLWTDVDGRYRGFDREIHEAKGFRYVTDLSLWDTFRTTHPLYALLFPEIQRDSLQSLAAMTQQGGYVPRWPMGGGDGGSMIGAHGASVAADSVAKGLLDFDVKTLYAGLKATMSAPLPPGAYGGLDGIKDFHKIGYVPRDDQSGSVSKTLEYAYNCACMATLAKAAGYPDDVAKWEGCAENYKNVWDAETGFFRARLKDGSFYSPFDPKVWHFDSNPEYVEGSGWQWLFFVPHDDAGLRGLFGGDATFTKRLEFFLKESADNFSHLIPSMYYYHGNEPDIDAAWLFIEAGKPARSQYWTRWITTHMVLNKPDGLPGNEDGGTLAAWTVFATLGLYPRPGLPHYVISCPLVDRAVLHLPGGDLVVEAKGAGKLEPEDIDATLDQTIDATTWQGSVWQANIISHGQLKGGGTLQHTLK